MPFNLSHSQLTCLQAVCRQAAVLACSAQGAAAVGGPCRWLAPIPAQPLLLTGGMKACPGPLAEHMQQPALLLSQWPELVALGLATVQVEKWLDDAYCITPLSSCFSSYLAPMAPPPPPPSVATCLPPNTTTTICLTSG